LNLISPLAGSRRWIADFISLAALWGASFLFMRICAVEFGALPTAAMRVGVAALFLTPLMLLRGQGADFARHWKPVLLMGLLNSGIPFALYSFALLAITTGLSAILNATVPLFGAVVAWLWFNDRPQAARVLGLAVGFAGVALLAWDKASFKPDASGIVSGWAVLACLGATLCYGLAASFAKRYLAGVPALASAAGSQIGATLGLALPALWFWPAQTPSAAAWASAVMVGVFCTGVAYILYFRILKEAGPSRALAVTFVVPVFAVFYGAVFLREAVTPWMVFCAAVIVLGTALSTGLLKLNRAGSPPR
jgi:drug/metabolite transporter (DMT)-like permease